MTRGVFSRASASELVSALTKFCVADIGNFGKCTQTLAQLNTPQVWTCKQSIVNNVFAVSVDANITISHYKQWS